MAKEFIPKIALTVTFKKHIYNKPIDQFNHTIYDLYNRISRCWETFEINPELMELSNNIHYHCTLEGLKDSYKWKKHVLPNMKYDGFIKLTKIKSHKQYIGWQEYCAKDQNEMQKILTTKNREVKLPILKSLQWKRKRLTSKALNQLKEESTKQSIATWFLKEECGK